ncbi:MAG TPA: Asp-tRNA(Asn)/Glu-tRNA(Gln) amidotransferase GatCAB subunit A [Dehalococcoidia bacterium]|nr:Asp-tRNA(Asn)/Glu-tRNA(Gln) amidotransferase GatCAB subunit A [Dehalococcoidia bacterium]
MKNLCKLSIEQASTMLKKREISSVELTDAVLERISSIDNKVHAFMTVCRDSALQMAKKADKTLASKKDAGALTGIPILIKDNICTKGIRTTCSSKMLENFIPPYNATVIDKLISTEAVILGKANMDEFAMGSSTENSAFFCTSNPWDLQRVPGGSSGGSAAAVAADETLAALGSDTGGSIRQPAGFCSVVGLKPTYGRVSRYGLVAFASSLDQIGPFTKTVTDSALVMNAISGHDEHDSTSVSNEVPDFTKTLVPDLRGMKLGIPKEYFVEGMQPEVKTVLITAIRKLEQLGASIDWEVSLPNTKYALAAYYILAPAEASANLARYDGVKYGFSFQNASTIWEAMEKTKQFGFGAEVKRRIMLGTYALSAGYYDAYYLKAQKIRTLIRREFTEAFKKYDALITPTSPTVPFKIGEKTNDPVQMYLSDVCTLPINIAGVPAVSIPAGFVDNLPVGMQIIGNFFGEETIFRTAYAYEQATEWHKQKPPIA